MKLVTEVLKMNESQVFRSKIYKAFRDAPKRLRETGSGTCIQTGERDYGFSAISEKDGRQYGVTRLRSGKFEVVEYSKELECSHCKGTGFVNKERKKVIR